MHGYELSTLGYGDQILLIATTTFALQLSQVVHIFQFALQHFPTPSKHFFSLLVLKIQGLLKLASLLNKENEIFPSFNRLNLHLCHASMNATLEIWLWHDAPRKIIFLIFKLSFWIFQHIQKQCCAQI